MPTATNSEPPTLTPNTKGLKPLDQLLKSYPGGEPSRPTKNRWLNEGVDSGIKLPAIRIGRVWFSTREALNWFILERSKTSI